MKTCFTISDHHYETLKSHLFPGDGKEAVAVALCGRNHSTINRGLVVHDLMLIPYHECQRREAGYVHWPTTLIRSFLEKAVKYNLSIAKIHCHPEGGHFFSTLDDQSDQLLFDSVYGWVSDDGPHASLVMLPEGKLFGRFITPDIRFQNIDRVKVAGDDIRIWDSTRPQTKSSDFDLRNIQAFGEGTINILKGLRIGIIGCSGTGGPTAVQLARLGVGELYLVDPDKVEAKNLNRIPTTKKSDIGHYKTEVLKRELEQIGSGTKILSFPDNLYDDVEVIKRLSSCDVLFGCMDSIDGRHLLNQIAAFYLIPYIDIGVKLIADGLGGVEKICYTVHYLKPGQSLMARRVYSYEDLAAAGLQRVDPEEFNRRIKEKYIQNAPVESPAVISVNTSAASKAVLELLARLHRYRREPNSQFNIQQWEEVDYMYLPKEDKKKDEQLISRVGRGDMMPLLNMPELSQPMVV